jgi:hypothetical protein
MDIKCWTHKTECPQLRSFDDRQFGEIAACLARNSSLSAMVNCMLLSAQMIEMFNVVLATSSYLKISDHLNMRTKVTF